MKKNYTYVKPIITPRFTPSCTDDYMEKLGQIARKYNLSVQSHLSENLEEIHLVKKDQMILFMENHMINMDYLGTLKKLLWLIVFIALMQKMI